LKGNQEVRGLDKQLLLVEQFQVLLFSGCEDGPVSSPLVILLAEPEVTEEFAIRRWVLACEVTD
jgi:hypothetical protein